MEDEKQNQSEDGAPIPTSKESESPAVELIDKDTQSPPKSPAQDPAPVAAETDKMEWVTGLKLAVIIAAITMAAFLMLLDVSIVATVSVPLLFSWGCIDDLVGDPENH